MKLLCSIVIVLSTMQISAQDPQLYEYTWYLQDLIIDGVSNPPPPNSDAAFVSLMFEEEPPFEISFETIVCQFMNSEVVFDNPSSSFSFLQPLDVGGIKCEPFSISEEYETLYFSFFQANFNHPFTYELDTISNITFLTINTVDGDTAIYANQILGQSDEQALNLVVYPNPTSDMLYLQSRQEISNMTLYDRSSKKIPVVLNTANNSIDLTQIAAGFYLLNIYFDEQNITKSIIKR